jgi:hypothetical protein
MWIVLTKKTLKYVITLVCSSRSDFIFAENAAARVPIFLKGTSSSSLRDQCHFSYLYLMHSKSLFRVSVSCILTASFQIPVSHILTAPFLASVSYGHFSCHCLLHSNSLFSCLCLIHSHLFSPAFVPYILKVSFPASVSYIFIVSFPVSVYTAPLLPFFQPL